MVDALVSGTSVRKDVEVRVFFWAPNSQKQPALLFDLKCRLLFSIISNAYYSKLFIAILIHYKSNQTKAACI